ncbi:MAG TPA: hypothetical protein VK770_16365 [Candidatus Acidoferrum sp.]|nr:hypothetical protein [Candidatus Acidoferrum sp.]
MAIGRIPNRINWRYVVQKNSSLFRLALCALCLLSFIGLRAYGQDRDKDQTNEHPNGIVQDWSRRHVAYPRVGPIKSMIALQNDPRAIQSWREQIREDWHRDKERHHHRDHDNNQDDIPSTASGLHQDWSISLGNGSTAPAMFPAKFGFDPNAAADCINDFVVFPVNIAGSSSQPNLVAFNQLYSGSIGATGIVTNGSITVAITAGTITPVEIGLPITGAGIPANDTIASITGNPATSITLATAATASNAAEALTIDAGLCNRATSASDTGIAAKTYWSYDINAAGGLIATSPALSIDGKKVAFVETVAGSSAHFHVLAWKSPDGVDATNLQNVLLPVAVTSFTGSAPVAGSGTATSLSFGSTGDTLSSPFVDYDKDAAYVGNDAGVLFRFKDVFCPTGPLIDAACAGGSPPAPSLDLSWPTTGPTALTGTVNVCSGKLTGAVVDFSTGNVFVGCADGNLYGFTSAGAALTPALVAVGDGTTTANGNVGGIVDPPLIDVVNGFAYAVSGSSVSGPFGGSSVLVQAKTDFSSTSTAQLGNVVRFPLHAPSFNDAYFNGTISNSLIYDWAVESNNHIAFYGVTFSAGHVMNSGFVGLVREVPLSAPVELSPTTTFQNGTDRLFVSGLTNASPNFLENDINTFPSAYLANFTEEGTGTSGIVVDNVSGSAQASSIYFGVLGALPPNANSAVKLTQSGLL